MGNAWESRTVLGVRLDHLIAGTFLFSVALAIVAFSVLRLVPAVQSRLPDDEARLYP
jgi:hypothetical protein